MRLNDGMGLPVVLLCCACDARSAAPKSDGANRKADASDASVLECQSQRDCVAQHGEHWICRRDQRCVSLLSEACTFIRGDDASDDAVFVGLLGPDTGVQQLFGASELARGDFASVAGLPLAKEDIERPLVLVGCSFAYGTDPLPSARHLIESVGVPVIIGPATSGDVINVAQNVAIPAGALLMAPFAQSDLLTDLADQDLVFRTTPTTSSFAPLLAAMVSDFEKLLRGERAASEIKVALVSARDAYGIALSAKTLATLRFNGGLSADENEAVGRLLVVSYDLDEEGFADEVAERVVDFEPDLVLSLSGFESRPLQAIEGAWPAGALPPYYVLDGIGGSSSHLDFIGSEPDALRKRVRITMNTDPTAPSYLRYLDRAKRESSAALLLGATVYDAAYAVAYGVVASAKSQVTGGAIARGLRRLVGGGQAISVFPDEISAGIEALLSGKTIDLMGVSGPLDFDDRGDVNADSAVGCLSRDQATGKVVPTFGGQVFRVARGELEGTFQCD